MKRLILVAALAITASGCAKPVDEWEAKHPVDLKSIQGLEDCVYQRVFTDAVNLHVIRCPNSAVSTTRGGKNPATTITVDGVQYHSDTD